MHASTQQRNVQQSTEKAVILGPIPEGVGNVAHLLEPYGVDRLSSYDYVQEEFFVSGTSCDSPYQTRILVRRPADMSRFNGRALCEVSHIWGGTSVWRAYHRELMRRGFMWVEIDSQAPSALDLIKASNPQRYSGMNFIAGEMASDFAATIPFTENPTPETLAREYDEFKVRWWAATPQSLDIIAQTAHALRDGLPGVANSEVRHAYFAGISQTGGVVRRFIELMHESARTSKGEPLFSGYLPGASGGDALPDIDAKVIEILGESEFQSVRWSCGVSGQVRGLTHRREDSDSFRLYEIAGMAHRETRYMSDRDRVRLKDCTLPEGARWSRYPNTYVYNAILNIMVNWAENGIQAPPSMMLDTAGQSDNIRRDEHGNARGGYRLPFIDVPLSSLVAATPVGRPSWYHGNETPFAAQKLQELYGDPAEYRRRLARSLDSMLTAGTLLAEDAETLRLEGELVKF